MLQISGTLLLPNLWLKFPYVSVGKTTRPFRYDINQIPYDYIVELTNRLKGLDLTEYLKNYGQRFMTGSVIKTIPTKEEMQKDKMVV